MNTNDRRTGALADFDDAGRAFKDVIQRAPAESLSYLKPGDDYALGGLVYHVNAVLEHYLGALDALAASAFQATECNDRPGLFEEANARAKAGLQASERAGVLATTERLHSDVRNRFSAFAADDIDRKGPVRFEPGAEPYPTSPADVLGWLTDHYREHVPHAQQLLESWTSQ